MNIELKKLELLNFKGIEELNIDFASSGNCYLVGMTGFEPATPSPPDLYANQAALHPDISSYENYS